MSPLNATLLLALATCVLALVALRRRAARTQRDLRSLMATTTELRHLADHDALTGLPNRRRFEQELARHLAHVRRYGPEGAVLILDLDCFKPVNDTFGHAAGDRLLARVACVLQERLRATDVVARLGGDEFAVLLPRVDRAGAGAVARSLVETVRAEALTADARGVTVSVGVIAFDAHAPLVPEGVLAAADVAMYDAKATGGDGWALYAQARVTAAALRPAPRHSPAVAVT
ncbi:MAG: GGDEF domain-containing protein [Actinobacteria bacterium]|nr:GGDEF domain-containing protein [Actinomycetota bacterium]